MRAPVHSIFVSGFNFNLHIDWVIYNLRYIKFTGSVEITDRHRSASSADEPCGRWWMRRHRVSQMTKNAEKKTRANGVCVCECESGYGVVSTASRQMLNQNQHSYVFLTIVLIKMSTGKKNTETHTHGRGQHDNFASQTTSARGSHRIAEHTYTFRWLGSRTFYPRPPWLVAIVGIKSTPHILCHSSASSHREFSISTIYMLRALMNQRQPPSPPPPRAPMKCIERPGWFGIWMQICGARRNIKAPPLTMMLMTMEG